MSDRVDHLILVFRFVKYVSEQQIEEGHADYRYICEERPRDRERIEALKAYIMAARLEARDKANAANAESTEMKESDEEISAQLDSVFKCLHFGWERDYPGEEHGQVCRYAYSFEVMPIVLTLECYSCNIIHRDHSPQ